MIIDTEKIQKLLDSDVTGYKISQATGIHTSLISNYRSKQLKLENMSLGIAFKFMSYINNEEKEGA